MCRVRWREGMKQRHKIEWKRMENLEGNGISIEGLSLILHVLQGWKGTKMREKEENLLVQWVLR